LNERITISQVIINHAEYNAGIVKGIIRKYESNSYIIQNLENQVGSLLILKYESLLESLKWIQKMNLDPKEINYDDFTVILEVIKYIAGFRVLERSSQRYETFIFQDI